MKEQVFNRPYLLEKLTRPDAKRKRRSGRKLYKFRFENLKKLDVKFSSMKPIHDMWKAYMQSVVRTDEDVSKADLHGAYLLVSRSKCDSQRGLGGIVVVESRNTFLLVTPDDRLVTIPKHGSLFRFVLSGRLYALVGDALCQTPSNRMHKKFKTVAALPDFRDQLVDDTTR